MAAAIQQGRRRDVSLSQQQLHHLSTDKSYGPAALGLSCQWATDRNIRVSDRLRVSSRPKISYTGGLRTPSPSRRGGAIVSPLPQRSRGRRKTDREIWLEKRRRQLKRPQMSVPGTRPSFSAGAPAVEHAASRSPARLAPLAGSPSVLPPAGLGDSVSAVGHAAVEGNSFFKKQARQADARMMCKEAHNLLLEGQEMVRRCHNHEFWDYLWRQQLHRRQLFAAYSSWGRLI